jgi:hypothetical protein
MTTIVYDGTTLASDSQTTGSNPRMAKSSCPSCKSALTETHSFRNKIQVPKLRKTVMFHGEQVVAWASAGSLEVIQALDIALHNGIDVHHAANMIGLANHSSPVKGGPSCSTIIVGKTKTWLLNITGLKCNVKEVDKLPCVVGSGSSAARFALNRLNLNAIGAVAAAMDSDTGSGGDINYIDCTVEDPAVQHYSWTEEDTAELINDILKP